MTLLCRVPNSTRSQEGQPARELTEAVRPEHVPASDPASHDCNQRGAQEIPTTVASNVAWISTSHASGSPRQPTNTLDHTAERDSGLPTSKGLDGSTPLQDLDAQTARSIDMVTVNAESIRHFFKM